MRKVGAAIGITVVAAFAALVLHQGWQQAFGPDVLPVAVERCKVLDPAAARYNVEVETRLNRLDLAAEVFRLEVTVDGATRPVRPWIAEVRVVPFIGTRTSVPLPRPSAARVSDLAIRCTLYRAGVEDHIDRRSDRPFHTWPSGRRIVFLSGVGTGTRNAAATFRELSEGLAELVSAKNDQDTFVHYSYTGKYEEAAGAKGLDTLFGPLRVPNIAQPLFSPIDVCAGVASASAKLRDLLKDFPQGSEFDLIGHSFGGFVAAHLLATLGDSEADERLRQRIHSVTTLDSPLAGLDPVRHTVIALTGCAMSTTIADDVARGSSAVATIGRLQHSDSLPHFNSFGNRRDVAVPADIAHTTASTPWHVSSEWCMSDLQHGCVLLDREVRERIAQILLSEFRPRSVIDDHPDQVAAAKLLRHDTVVPGRISPADDIDLFRVPVRAGQSYTIRLTLTPGADRLDAQLTRLDRGGSVVAPPTEITPDAEAVQVTWRAAETEEVTVAVTSGSAATGNYNILLTTGTPDPNRLALGVRLSGLGDGRIVGVDNEVDCASPALIRPVPTRQPATAPRPSPTLRPPSSTEGRRCSTLLLAGTIVRLNAALRDDRVLFGGWTGACQGQGLACTFTLAQDSVVAARFHENRMPSLAVPRQSCDAGRANMSLTWSAPPDALEYVIERNSSVIAMTAAPGYLDRSLVPGTYRYAVSARYEGHASTIRSNVIDVDVTRCP